MLYEIKADISRTERTAKVRFWLLAQTLEEGHTFTIAKAPDPRFFQPTDGDGAHRGLYDDWNSVMAALLALLTELCVRGRHTD